MKMTAGAYLKIRGWTHDAGWAWWRDPEVDRSKQPGGDDDYFDPYRLDAADARTIQQSRDATERRKHVSGACNVALAAIVAQSSECLSEGQADRIRDAVAFAEAWWDSRNAVEITDESAKP